VLRNYATFLVLLACACDVGTETLGSGPYDPQAGVLAQAAPVKLPPSIAKSRTYRCADNIVVHADFLTNDTVILRTDGSDTMLLHSTNGQPPFEANGYSLSGDETKVTFARPGAGSQSCRS
jgi:hypothetical protein